MDLWPMDTDSEMNIECLGLDTKCIYRIILKEKFGYDIKVNCTNRKLMIDLYESYKINKQRRITKLEYPDEADEV
jgi:hypothetical protein